MKRSLIILLLSTLALAQSQSLRPQPRYETTYRESWPKRHRWIISVGSIAAGAATGYLLGRHTNEYCWKEVGNTYTYTGTPWNGAGPNGCPLGQEKSPSKPSDAGHR